MSAYTTITFTRSKAIQEIMSDIQSRSNRELEEILDMVLEKRLYNSIIVSDDSQIEADVS